MVNTFSSSRRSSLKHQNSNTRKLDPEELAAHLDKISFQQRAPVPESSRSNSVVKNSPQSPFEKQRKRIGQMVFFGKVSKRLEDYKWNLENYKWNKKYTQKLIPHQTCFSGPLPLSEIQEKTKNKTDLKTQRKVTSHFRGKTDGKVLASKEGMSEGVALLYKRQFLFSHRISGELFQNEPKPLCLSDKFHTFLLRFMHQFCSDDYICTHIWLLPPKEAVEVLRNCFGDGTGYNDENLFFALTEAYYPELKTAIFLAFPKCFFVPERIARLLEPKVEPGQTLPLKEKGDTFELTLNAFESLRKTLCMFKGVSKKEKDFTDLVVVVKNLRNQLSEETLEILLKRTLGEETAKAVNKALSQ